MSDNLEAGAPKLTTSKFNSEMRHVSFDSIVRVISADDDRNRNFSYPFNVFLEPEKASIFSCASCGNVPCTPLNNEEGQIFCENCADKSINGKNEYCKGIKTMINNLETWCLNNPKMHLKPKPKPETKTQTNNNDHISDSDSESDSETCDWRGRVKDWYSHNASCDFAMVTCKFCHEFKCIRQDMHEHLVDDCPKIIVGCPLKCEYGKRLTRDQVRHHLSTTCDEAIVACPEPHCEVQLKRRQMGEHVDGMHIGFIARRNRELVAELEEKDNQIQMMKFLMAILTIVVWILLGYIGSFFIALI